MSDLVETATIAPHTRAHPRPTRAGSSPRLVSSSIVPLHRRAIVVVIHDFALGGTERIAVRLAGEWVRTGHDVRIFAGSLTGPLLGLVDPAVRVTGPATPIVRAPGSLGRLAAAAAAHCRAERIDACFIPGNTHWPVASAIGRLPDEVRPIVLAQVSAALRKPQRGPLKQIVYDMRMRWLLRHADAVLVLCAQAGEQADAILGRKASAVMPLPALDDRTPRPTLCSPDNQRIIAAGRLVPEKGFDTLIRAFALVVGDNDAARLTIVGEGPDRARLTAFIESLGLSGRIDLPGFTPDIRPWLDAARLFVLSSRFEGYGAVIIEALAAGRQVVATDCTPATSELLYDATVGRVVPIDDAAAMAASISNVLAGPISDPFRLAALIDRFHLAPVARQHIDLIERLLARQNTQSPVVRPYLLPVLVEPLAA